MLASELLEIGERPSFRALEEHRDVSLNLWPNIIEIESSGSAVIITYELGFSIPHIDKPGEGVLHIGLVGKKNDILLSFLNGIYINSKCVALEVCEYGRKVQSLSIDIKVVSTDGNLFQLCVKGINEVIKSLKLKSYFTPTILTYAGYKNRVVSDPDASELDVCDWTGYIVMKSVREILFTNVEGRPCCNNAVNIIIDKAFEDISNLNSNKDNFA
ncbi:hypothetical protein PAEPH01_0423 [Pancytospora epiphaga]|nr:hypothetical protein PAEPH01_0423 [Pancytospora epiphaga]